MGQIKKIIAMGLSSVGASAAAAVKPNIIRAFADDIGYGDVDKMAFVVNCKKGGLVFKSFFLFLVLFLSSIPVYSQAGEINSSGRTSYFWLTLKSQAGTKSGADTDLILTNGYRSVDLSSPDLSCIRKENGTNYMGSDLTKPTLR